MSKDCSKLDKNFKQKNGINFKTIDMYDNSISKYLGNNKNLYDNIIYWKNNKGKVGEIIIDSSSNKYVGHVMVNNKGVISPIYVLKEYRGYGLGDVLLKDAIEKYNGTSLGVYEDNEVAIKLYKKHGFKIVGSKKYKNDDTKVIIMSLKESTDYIFTIEPTIDFSELQTQKTIYDSLPYDQRVHCNDECIRKYGVTNDILYNVNMMYIKKQDNEDSDIDIPGWFLNIIEDIKNDNTVTESYIKEKFEYNNLNKFNAYHLEYARSGFNYKIPRGWDEELYSKNIEWAIKNDILGKSSLKNENKINAHVYTTTNDLSPIYLGIITIYKYDNDNFDWGWSEQVDLDKYTYEEIIRNPLGESTLIETKSILDPNFKKKQGGNFEFININDDKALKYLKQDKIGKKENLEFIFKNYYGEIVIDKNKDKLAGYVFVYNNGIYKGYVEPLWLFKEYRGYGLGDKLIKDAIFKYGATSLDVDKNNEVAINLYKKHGFVIVLKGGRKKPKYYMKLKSKLTKINTIMIADTIENMIENKDNINNLSESSIDNYKRNIQCNDLLEMYMRELDLISISNNGSLYESSISEDMISSLSYSDKLSINVPQIVPYFTPEEILDFGGEPTEFVDRYKNSCCTGLYNFNYINEYNKVRELYREYSISKESLLEKEIINLGWNPSVEPNANNLKFARERIKRYIDENYELDIIDLSNYIVKEDIDVEYIQKDLTPIFIVLSYTNTTFGNMIKRVRPCNYTHAAISFESDLKNLYSFNRQKDEEQKGLSFESIDDYKKKSDQALLKVLCIFVNQHQKAKIRARLEYYISNKNNTKYSTKNLFNILLNRQIDDNYSLKMVCSQFVDSLLKCINIDITNKSSNLVSPDDFDKIKDEKVYIMFEGLAKNYNYKTIDKKVKSISLNRLSQYKLIDVKEAVELLFNNKDLLLFKSIRINNEKANSVLDNINDILYVKESVFTEAIKPFKANDEEIEIKFPTQIEEEYQKSHKLLLEYDKVNNLEGIKSELAKLWYLNNIAERRINGRLKISKDKITKTRARILNDFKKYLNIVLKEEPNFNFTEYFNKSNYYDGSISVDTKTLKWSGKILKSLIKPI